MKTQLPEKIKLIAKNKGDNIMKTKGFLLIVALTLLLNNCKKNDSDDTGTLVFQGVPPYTTQGSAKSSSLKSTYDEITNVMHTANLKGLVTGIWVSQGLVTEGVTDDFQWYKIGESNELKLIEEYSFTVNDLPVGDYQSIKLAMKNILTRIAVYQSNINETVEMQSSISEESCGNDSIITQYFSKNGNHNLVNGIFQLSSEGENVRGFKIRPDEVTSIFWRLGGADSKITDCTFDWVDVNVNGVWDCGTDRTANFNCIVDMPMFSFSVDDGEEPEEEFVILNAVTDIDGNIYDAVKIGDQTWMKEDLKTTRLNDSTDIPDITDNQEWKDAGWISKSPAQCVYNNNTGNESDTYGRLYNWYAVSTQKLCPAGWHVPSDEEWTILINYIGTRAGGKMKEAGTVHWKSPNEGADNKSGFTALPGGSRYMDAEFIGIGEAGLWWTSTVKEADLVWTRGLHYSVDYEARGEYDKMFGACVRCLKD